jgi:hypothetical protein
MILNIYIEKAINEIDEKLKKVVEVQGKNQHAMFR